MKTAQQILKYIDEQIEDIESIQRNMALTDIGKERMDAKLEFAKATKIFIKAPVPFDRDLMGSSEDKEER